MVEPKETMEVSLLGQHRVFVRTRCHNPRVWMRITGDALIPIPLNKVNEGLVGLFAFPVEGNYKLERRWYSCDEDHTGEKSEVLFESTAGIEFKVLSGSIFLGNGLKNTERKPEKKKREINFSDSVASMFDSSAAWLSVKKVLAVSNPANYTDNLPQSGYIWVNPQKAIEKDLTFVVTNQDGAQELAVNRTGADGALEILSKIRSYPDPTLLVNEGTVSSQDAFYDFRLLGDWQVVCFVGTESARRIHSFFLTLRQILYPTAVQAVKFHYYEATTFLHPDYTWTEREKRLFRKCKQVFISFDEVRNNRLTGNKNREKDPSDFSVVPLSAWEYRTQITTFINHLVKAHNDYSFPIWILTVAESPIDAINCHDSMQGIPLHDHPCNVILKDLFQRNKARFPDRVRLMDNTDLSSPQWETKGRNNIMEVIALRIFVLIGKMVSEWRRTKQYGQAEGLLRKGKLAVPNFELVPYEWS